MKAKVAEKKAPQPSKNVTRASALLPKPAEQPKRPSPAKEKAVPAKPAKVSVTVAKVQPPTQIKNESGKSAPKVAPAKPEQRKRDEKAARKVQEKNSKLAKRAEVAKGAAKPEAKATTKVAPRKASPGVKIFTKVPVDGNSN